ncbi:3-carboxy-cis,cis-muconate cycloisomerase [Aureimonas sp. AU12]|uniref:3-carboxy-cis,cis-muconate cycloisomerase n=1 Tax=Aureimonas sp. AU12 TaxID=1638161 RepID=UPI0007844FCD|nr:3-carboxy-cis,cis-muconate cycloisomerase [Aureimonas sp. AU12]
MESADRPLAHAFASDAAIAAQFSMQAEIAAILEFEAALAEAQAELGIFSLEAGVAIREAVGRMGKALDHDDLRRGFARDGVVVPALVRQLREAVGAPHAASVHKGATSQDAIDTGLMLRLKPVVALLGERLDALLARLDAWTAEQGDSPLMAHTRMQAALPFTVAAKLATWRRPLLAHRARLAALPASTLAVQLGGPVGDGSSFGPQAAELSAALARRLALADAAPWHSDRTRILDIAQALAVLTGTLGKIGQDAALLAQSEVGALQLLGGGGSSAMAHKQNPVGAEVLVALARLNAGLAGTMQQAMIHENERSGAAWTLEWFVLPPMAEAAGAGLRLADALLTGARFTCRATA